MHADPMLPATADDAAAMLREAAITGAALRPGGQGTRTHWRPDPREARIVGSSRLVDGFEHYAGDLVATVPAGMTLIEANSRLAAAGQWLPLDPPRAGSIGGLVATNDSGPRRLRHGTPRDLIVGIEVALTDGRVVQAGGRVVKNVAGYDLSRLFCGSYGSLGLVTRATFKLAPLPQASCTVVAQFADAEAALAAAAVVDGPSLTPSSVEMQAPEWRLLVRFETSEAAAALMAEGASALLQRRAASVAIVRDSQEAEVWRDHAHRLATRRGVLLKVVVLPTAMSRLFALLSDARVHWSVSGRATLGVALLALQGDDAQIVTVARGLTQYAREHRGHVSLLDAADAMRAAVPLPASPAAAVMRAIKQRFDPAQVLPGVPDGR